MNYYYYEPIRKMLMSLFETVKTLDPFIIADYFGIEYKFIEASEAFEGETNYILGEPLLLINSRFIDNPYKYAIMAHELYHALEHPGLVSYYSSGASQKDKLEYEANKFTAALLINFYTERTGLKPMYLQDLKNEFGIGDEYEEFYF